MDEPAALHAINLVVHTVVIALLLGVLARLVSARQQNGAALRGLVWVFWGLLGFFGAAWFGRVEAILDLMPDFDLLGWVRKWIFLPELVLVYGLVLFWREVQGKKS